MCVQLCGNVKWGLKMLHMCAGLITDYFMSFMPFKAVFGSPCFLGQPMLVPAVNQKQASCRKDSSD